MQSPESSIIFSIGNFDIHYYGVIMFFAIITGMFVMAKVARKYYPDVDREILVDILPVIIISAILGARLYYVILDLHYYSKHWGEIFAIWNGGLSLHGAIIGGVLAGWFYANKYNFSFLKYSDIFAYGLIIGQVIGRLGNYFNCEAFGTPTTLPFGLYIPEKFRPLEYMNYQYFHPTFLYEMVWNLFVFCILFFVIRKIPKIQPGTIFFNYLLFYSIGRFIIEGIRVDSVLDVGNIPVARIVSMLIIIGSAFGLFWVNRAKPIG